MNKKIANILLSDGYLSQWIVLLMDLVLSLVASLTAMLTLRLIIDVTYFSLPLLLICGISVVASLSAFFISRSHTVVIRHSSFKSIWRLILASVLKAAFMAAGLYAFCGFTAKEVVLAAGSDAMFTALFLISIRLVMIWSYDIVLARMNGTPKARLLIYGTSEKSVALKIRLHKSEQYYVVGFVAYGRRRSEMSVADADCHYFTTKEEFAKLISSLSISAVLFANESDARSEAKRLITFASELPDPVKILVAPPVDELTSDNQSVLLRMRPIKIEDLLGREEIYVNRDEIIANVYGKVVLVTGGAGSIGSEICRQLALLGVRRLVILDNAESPLHNICIELDGRFPGFDFIPYIADVRSFDCLKTVFEKYHPQLVFHAAAYKHVPMMERFPCEAVVDNVLGTKNVADLSVEYGVEKMVMISTDKAVNPTNVMGCTKRLAEIYCQSLGLAISSGSRSGSTKFVTTRFGNVLGSNGSVIPLFNSQIAAGGPVTVTDERITRYFMTIPEACRLVLEAAVMGDANEIMVFDMGEPVRIVDVARKMISLAGYVPDKDIKIKFVGLRPGEKLYEEVLSDKENTLPTVNPKIRVANVREYDREYVESSFDTLIRMAQSGDVMQTVKLMKDIVPEFISRNSVFECFDKSEGSSELRVRRGGK